MTHIASFIDMLQAAAEETATQETAFRRGAAERIKALEHERAFAFRKFNLMRSVADGVARAEDEDKAVTAGADILRSRLDWVGDSEAQMEVFLRFAPVIRTIYASLSSGEEQVVNRIGEALAEFEAWYEAAYHVPFWSLFEQPMVETPRVDF